MGKPKPSAKKGPHPKPPKNNTSKKQPSSNISSSSSPVQSPPVSLLPLSLQQQILSVFRHALLPTILSAAKTGGSDLRSIIQEVKTHLYNRDFLAAFGREDYLHAYALRWSASRALGYAEIFLGGEVGEFLSETTRPELPEDLDKDAAENDQKNLDILKRRKKVVCIGGGAGAEVMAFSAVAEHLSKLDLDLDIHAVDIADWSGVIKKLEESWKTSLNRLALESTVPESSTTPSSSQNLAENTPSERPDLTKKINDSNEQPEALEISTLSISDNTKRLPSNTTISFHHNDVLSTPLSSLRPLLSTPSTSTPLLITLLFTLNELFSTSISLTTKLLLNITDIARPGTMLLVIDSPGSYSEVSIGGAKKTTTNADSDDVANGEEKEQEKEKRSYPMKWLLDHTLLEMTKSLTPLTSRNDPLPAWEKVLADDSRWFRLPDAKSSSTPVLKYPIELENMRYQIHVFRKR